MSTDPPTPAGSALVRSLQDDVGIAVLNMNTPQSVPNITNVREADNMFLTHNPFKEEAAVCEFSYRECNLRGEFQCWITKLAMAILLFSYAFLVCKIGIR